ncbi:hypothetical protein DMC30DRAFT_351604 [Rhodotorula diobovata]|uniref:7alpha-cephem-methoxylase P8 chain related protein n=1 Tax=Rhodotorula diobovata TaxID=5288 RepID=A0A5C5FVR6_9BASI|nr:hypothetical protein DMC30DRAFT_351604 [Rhodotorula diobovata]
MSTTATTTAQSPSSLAAAAKEFIEAPLYYFSGETTDGKQPYQLQYPSPGPHLPFTNSVIDTYPTEIRDLRPLVGTEAANEVSIETTGFGLVPRDKTQTSMSYDDWRDEDKIKNVYYREVEDLFKKQYGASRVIIFDHTIRRGEKPGEETPDTPTSRKPIPRVHVDQTPDSGTRRVLRHGGEDGERLLRGRAQLINVWRPLRGPVYDMPLAFADARTLDTENDLVRARLLYPTEGEFAQPEGETLTVKHNPAHRWFYLSEMSADEVLLLKCWENLPDRKIGTITPHTAFHDPRYFGKEGVELRESIEVRALVFHEADE